jgi:hypothetical protein
MPVKTSCWDTGFESANELQFKRARTKHIQHTGEVNCGNNARQYGELEKCIIPFLPRSGDRTLLHSGGDVFHVCLKL